MISIYTRIGKFIKFVTGIQDISLFRKNFKKKIGKIIYKKKYNSSDIVKEMCRLGMKKGSIVCIHSSMKEFYNFEGTAETLIDAIIDVLTPDGTLVMPAFPNPELRMNENYVFDFNKEITKAGYLAETFRKRNGVLRSINAQHSICALGKYAKLLTEGHEYCQNCWDINSPWYKLCTMNALIFSLGMPSSYIGTFQHCVEGTLFNKHPYWASFFNKKRTYYYYDKNGDKKQYECLEGDVEVRVREKRVTKYFTKDDMQQCKISNLLIKVCYSKSCFDKMIGLGKRGVSMYYIPSTKGYLFDN